MSSSSSSQQSRFWCFTLFQFEDWAKPVVGPDQDVTYMCFQQEVCPDTERVHLQGYVEFLRKQRMSEAKAKLNNKSIHLEARRGTGQQARAYCCEPKSGYVPNTFVELGSLSPAQGARTDLAQLHAYASQVNGRDVAQEEAPVMACQHSRFVQVAYEYAAKKRAMESRHVVPKVVLFYGSSGSGKTELATQAAVRIAGHDLRVYMDMTYANQGLRFPNYAEQTVLRLDEFDPSMKCRADFLKLCQPGLFLADVKYGHVYVLREWIFITCQRAPELWYLEEQDVEAVVRRCHLLVEFTGKWKNGDVVRRIRYRDPSFDMSVFGDVVFVESSSSSSS